MPLPISASLRPLGTGDVGGQRRAADGAQIELDDRRATRRPARRPRARRPRARRRGAGRSESSARGSGGRRRGSWPAPWPNRCRPKAARSRRSCAITLPRRWRARAILSKSRALRLGVPAAPRRRALLRHARRRARRAGAGSRLRHGPPDGAAAARRPRRRRARPRARDAGARGGARRAAGADGAPARAAAARGPARAAACAPRSRSRSRRSTASSTSTTDRELARFFAASRARWPRAAGWRSTPSPRTRVCSPARQRGRAAGAGRGRCFEHPGTGRRPNTRRATDCDGRAADDRRSTTGLSTGATGAAGARAARGPRPSAARPGRGRAGCSAGAGLALIASWGGFDGRPLAPATERAHRSSLASWNDAPSSRRNATRRQANAKRTIVKLLRRKTPGITP